MTAQRSAEWATPPVTQPWGFSPSTGTSSTTGLSISARDSRGIWNARDFHKRATDPSRTRSDRPRGGAGTWRRDSLLLLSPEALRRGQLSRLRRASRGPQLGGNRLQYARDRRAARTD